uniref:Peptidase S1 domain-containing protein n=1 Tax=Biomphalaria glabrata TaxID=6526 RepID=A0A2C9KTJ3_BIOGL
MCPSNTQAVSTMTRRTLNGVAIGACDVGGVVAIRDNETSTILCTGVLTSKSTFIVPQDCAIFYEETLKSQPITQIVTIGKQQDIILTQDLFTYKNLTNGMAEIALPQEVSVTDCPEYACTYDSAKMAGRVNFNDCFGVGYGSRTKGDCKWR